MSVDVSALVTENLDIWSSTIKAKNSQGRGSSKKTELYGVTKLRELILELAVRGLLVPQDPSDEPASVLLEKIAAEKARLVKEKKIKKQKSLPPIAEDEQPFELPNGWAWTTMSHLGVFSGGKTPSKGNPEYWGGDIPWVTPKDMKIEEVFDSEDHVTNLAIDNGLPLIEENSLLFVARSGILRRKFPVAITRVQCTVNQDLKVLAPYDKNTANYSLIMMKGFESYILKNLTKTGTTVESLLFEKFCQHPFLLPPAKEQNRIVTKVNELMTLCDRLEQQQETSISAHQTLVESLLGTLVNAADATSFSAAWQRIAENFDLLFTTEHSIEQLKQNILQLAVMGKLVPQDPNDEPASVLLEKITKEKARLVNERKIKKQKPLPPIGDEEKPFELPVGWEWCRLDDVALKSEAGWSPQCLTAPRDKKSWGVLKVSAVSWGIFNENENKQLPKNLEPKPEYEVKPGDFLISRANTAELVARGVVVPKSVSGKLMMSDKIIRFTFSQWVSSVFISLVNNSTHARDYYASVAGGTSSSMKNVTREQIRGLVFGVPCLKEQHSIVTKVNELMTLCDTMLEHIKAAQTTQLNLTDAIAKQATA